MLLTVVINHPEATVDSLHSNLERLNLTPVSSVQIAHVLLSPFVEQFSSVLHYARVHCEIDDDTMFSSFLADVAVRCLEVAAKVFLSSPMYRATVSLGFLPCQGNMLRSMCEDYPSLADDIQLAAVTEYRLTVEDLPSPEQEKECANFASRLCRDLYAFNFEAVAAIQEIDEDGWHGSPSHSDVKGMKQGEGVPTPLPEPFLVRRYHASDACMVAERVQGDIGQETLTQAISRDELDPRRKKAPWLSYRINWSFTPPFPAGMSIALYCISQTHGG